MSYPVVMPNDATVPIVGKKIVALREKRFWARTDLSKESGVKLSSLQRIEQGTVESVTFETFRKLAAAFKIEPHILRRMVSPFPQPTGDAELMEVVIVNIDGSAIELSEELVRRLMQACDSGKIGAAEVVARLLPPLATPMKIVKERDYKGSRADRNAAQRGRE